MANIYDWSTTPGNNTTVGNINWTEGQYPRTVNNSARQEMAHVAAWRDFMGGVKVTATADTMTLTSGLSLSAYTQGVFAFECGAANTGATTLNIDSVGAKSVVKNYDQALAAGDLVAGGIYVVAYEETADNFQLLTPPTNGLSIGKKGSDVASATSLTLPLTADYFDITGTTTIAGIAARSVGGVVTLQFDGVLTLTHHATDFILTGGDDITTAAGDQAAFIEYASGDWRLLWYTVATPAAVEPTPYPPNYKSGFELSLGTDADHDIDIAAGYARDSTDAVNITGTAMTKQIDATWAAGTDAGGLFTGTVAADTTYYLFAIVKDSDSSVDYGFDVSSSCANIPTGYTKYLLLDTLLTDSSSNLINSMEGVFTSPAFWTADGGTSIYDHALGKIPDRARMLAIRKTASGNYAVGDTVILDQTSGGSSFGFQLTMKSTTISVAINISGILVTSNPGTTNTFVTTNSTDWNYQLVAEIS